MHSYMHACTQCHTCTTSCTMPYTFCDTQSYTDTHTDTSASCIVANTSATAQHTYPAVHTCTLCRSLAKTLRAHLWPQTLPHTHFHAYRRIHVHTAMCTYKYTQSHSLLTAMHKTQQSHSVLTAMHTRLTETKHPVEHTHFHKVAEVFIVSRSYHIGCTAAISQQGQSRT
jgi:hypothetical protein